MGLFALGPSGAADIPRISALGIGPADLVVSLTLVYVLMYLYLQEPVSFPPEWKRDFQVMLLCCAIPLGVAFLGVIIYKALTVV